MEYDAFVIGGGPAGYACAIRLAQKGKKVALAEMEKIGGECLNYGCIPSKALIELAHSVDYLRNMKGVTLNEKIDLGEWNKWKWSMIEKLTGGVSTLLKAWKIDVIHGKATLSGKNSVRVEGGKEYTSNNIIIATGSAPISIPGIEHVLYNREILDLKEIPSSMAIIGGGYIGVELGTAFAKLGTNVTIIEMMDKILPGIDESVSRYAEKTLKRLNVAILTGKKVKAVSKGKKFRVDLEDGSVDADIVFMSVGRRPNTAGLGLEKAGVEMDGNFIKTDSRKMTSVEGIYAIGDVTKGPMLAHRAYYDADIVASNISGESMEADYSSIPAVIYSDPEISTVGGKSAVEMSFPLLANGRALSMNAGDGAFRIFADEDGFITGAALAGVHSSEIISEITLAKNSGLTLTDIALTVHPHPTVSEALMEAAQIGSGFPLHYKPSR
ncbi:MAG: dihydrolipoyl dehydrogenase [Candidatus Thermoplasmatota archaeon]|nr:dihydrolipoyl dehydrogenase [Candidatus Thermoplasmatota archaeon]MCL5665660.1 dihydrolipoyl dehydrogenase [Candidatus Thermoplasmatota archaeon]